MVALREGYAQSNYFRDTLHYTQNTAVGVGYVRVQKTMDASQGQDQDQELTVSVRVRLRKSRHGCRTCKQRKIKCDEARPVCGNCAKRYYDVERCDYLSVPAPRQRRNSRLSKHAIDTSVVQPASGPLPTSLITRPTGVSANHERRQLEMRLMYHYTQFAALELPATYGYSSKKLWLDKVPQMAFESDLLLDSLLTVAAIHMQDLMPEDHKLGIAANHYLDRTLAKHRYSLGCIDKALAEPLFLTAFMLCITSWQFAHRRSLTLATIRGAVWSLVPSNNIVETDHPLLYDIKQDIDKLLEAFHVTTMPADEANACQDTADCVISLYMALVLKMDTTILQRLVFTMAVRMTSRYVCIYYRMQRLSPGPEVAMLEAGQPLALALYARILAVLGFIDHLWWSRGPNNRDFLHYSITGIANMMPLRYSWAMEWPRKVIAGEITLKSQAETHAI
ncbi:hypothetical protein NUW58_g1398 [Xylaria curta]|uniref:Uncharacterized protein n=1 Tax=Xylaria curta TaxID=42375 RepID=A0ACC1PMX7_9PEZI|nr:hypothetical protein NUW58_g1398 [Xylaria curta]